MLNGMDTQNLSLIEEEMLLAERRVRARRRAKRAAQVVTIGLALMGGCATTHVSQERSHDGEPAGYDGGEALDAATADVVTTADAAPEAAPDAAAPADSGPDSTMMVDAAVSCEHEDWQRTQECCDMHADEFGGWDWNIPGCQAWGPYVPPSADVDHGSRAHAIRAAVQRVVNA